MFQIDFGQRNDSCYRLHSMESIVWSPYPGSVVPLAMFFIKFDIIGKFQIILTFFIKLIWFSIGYSYQYLIFEFRPHCRTIANGLNMWDGRPISLFAAALT